jgi:hypothetical protein
MDLKMHLKMHFLFKCILNAFKNGKFFPNTNLKKRRGKCILTERFFAFKTQV